MNYDAAEIIARADRFWQKVDKTGDCWVWNGFRQSRKRAYGIWQYAETRRVSAHRASYILAHGSVPDDMDVCHHCDNPPCVRPDHLFIGTRSDNMRDCAAKGRNAMQNPEQAAKIRGDNNPMRRHPECAPRGSENGYAKLTERDVEVMRRLAADGVSSLRLARAFGMESDAAVRAIVSGQRWAHVPMPAAYDRAIAGQQQQQEGTT